MDPHNYGGDVVILSRTGVPGERALCACWGGLAKDPLMQSAMQMFVARFVSKDPRIRGGTDARRTTNIDRVSFSVSGSTNSGVLQLRFRMTAKN